MNWNIVISVFAFTVLFLSSLFLFLRDYPSDRTFSVTFILSGGVLLWYACGAGVCAAPKTDTDSKIEYKIDNLEASNENNENNNNESNAGKEQEQEQEQFNII